MLGVNDNLKHSTANSCNLATGSQTVGSHYLGYKPKLYTTVMSHSPNPSDIIVVYSFGS